MKGGVLDAVERRTTELLQAAQSAFVWLGLESAAKIIADVRTEIDAGALDEERAEQLEWSADERYNSLLPSDAALESAFRVRLVEMPEASRERDSPWSRWVRRLCRGVSRADPLPGQAETVFTLQDGGRGGRGLDPSGHRRSVVSRARLGARLRTLTTRLGRDGPGRVLHAREREGCGRP